MLKPLTAEQSRWVEETLAGMSLEEKVGHLLCPENGAYSPEEWAAMIREIPLGSIFIDYRSVEKSRQIIDALQSISRIPLLIASDLEHGPGAMIAGATDFPWPMAAGATGDERLLEAMGRATGREGRSYGATWTFSPVVDLNVNFQNPVTNVRALGDDPEAVSRLAAALIRGIQADGQMAATAKHFPGDGMDDRDQHLCTSVNSRSLADWWATYGKVWRTVIEAGVFTIMVGHISLPAYEGLQDTPSAAMPGTLNPRLQVDLLRKELGFEGLIVSDAAPMVGISSRVRSDRKALENILSGSDVFLFADPVKDFHHLLDAVRSGELPLAQVDESVRRVLALKARLGLDRGAQIAPLSAPEKAAFEQDAQAIAERSITLLRGDAHTPAALCPGARVLTVTVRHVRPDEDPANPHPRELAVVDEELRRRGYQVDHLAMKDLGKLVERAGAYDFIFYNVVIVPHSLMGTMRLTGELAMGFWNAFWVDQPNVIFTAFGSPYLLYEAPHLPNLYAAYGPSPASQAAAVRAWLGEIEPAGKAPVKFPAL